MSNDSSPAPPWGARHEWRQDSEGRWNFVERLDDDGEIHCPVAAEGVYPSAEEWDQAVDLHSVWASFFCE